MAQDFLPFGTGAGANVIDQATYAAASGNGFVAVGFAAGLAQSAQLNKVWRQATVIAYIIGQFTADTLNQDVLDNGDTAALLAQYKLAVGIGAMGGAPTTEITASADIQLNARQRVVGLFRASGLAPFTITLPPNPVDGDKYQVQDVLGGLFANPVTIAPATGNIRGLGNFVMNEDFQTCSFTYYEESNTWGVSSS